MATGKERRSTQKRSICSRQTEKNLSRRFFFFFFNTVSSVAFTFSRLRDNNQAYRTTITVFSRDGADGFRGEYFCRELSFIGQKYKITARRNAQTERNNSAHGAALSRPEKFVLFCVTGVDPVIWSAVGDT